MNAPAPSETARRGRVVAYCLLTMVALFWAINISIARATADEVPPLALSFWRMALSALVLAPFALRASWEARDLIRQHFWFLNLLAALSMTAFNGLVYVGLNYTQAINGNLLQGSLPICILVASALFAGRYISPRQWIGVALGLGGLMTIVIRGEPARLLAMEINAGDPIIFIGVFASATYAAILHRRPQGIGLVAFIFLMMAFSTIHLLPLYLWEHATQRTLPMTETAIGTVLYVTIFASVLAQLFFAEGIRRLGAPAAGNMIYLIPVFGVLIAVGLLGETFHGFHAVGVGLIALGIWLALFSRKPG